jgi:hypothetical protein
MLMAGLFALRGEVRRTLTIAAAGAGLFAVGLLWALRSGGDAVLARFRALLEGDSVASTYYSNRGHFVETALTGWLPKYPVGAGLGRWGMPYVYFGRRLPVGVPGSELYAEENITAWVFQGGIVMLAVMACALALAMFDMVRIARTTPDRDLALSAAVITSLCVGVLISAFGYVPFVAPSGLIFWLLAASLHAADQRVRRDQRQARPPSSSARAAPTRLGAPAR